MNSNRIWFMALVAALGGFLFGFDTIVINGAEQDISTSFFFRANLKPILLAFFFAFFSVMMVFHLLWAWFVVPETRGRRLEDIA